MSLTLAEAVALKPLRILVSGGRDFVDKDTLYRVLYELTDVGEMLPRAGTVIIHGDCPTGADSFADDWAVVNWTGCEPYPADWDNIDAPGALIRVTRRPGRAPKPYNALAGHWRNQQMLDEGKPDLVVAFPTGGPGTKDMMSRVRRAGVPMLVVAA